MAFQYAKHDAIKFKPMAFLKQPWNQSIIRPFRWPGCQQLQHIFSLHDQEPCNCQTVLKKQKYEDRALKIALFKLRELVSHEGLNKIEIAYNASSRCFYYGKASLAPSRLQQKVTQPTSQNILTEALQVQFLRQVRLIQNKYLSWQQKNQLIKTSFRNVLRDAAEIIQEGTQQILPTQDSEQVMAIIDPAGNLHAYMKNPTNPLKCYQSGQIKGCTIFRFNKKLLLLGGFYNCQPNNKLLEIKLLENGSSVKVQLYSQQKFDEIAGISDPRVVPISDSVAIIIGGYTQDRIASKFSYILKQSEKKILLKNVANCKPLHGPFACLHKETVYYGGGRYEGQKNFNVQRYNMHGELIDQVPIRMNTGFKSQGFTDNMLAGPYDRNRIFIFGVCDSATEKYYMTFMNVDTFVCKGAVELPYYVIQRNRIQTSQTTGKTRTRQKGEQHSETVFSCLHGRKHTVCQLRIDGEVPELPPFRLQE